MSQANMELVFTSDSLKKITTQLKQLKAIGKEIAVGDDSEKAVKNIEKINKAKLQSQKLTRQEINDLRLLEQQTRKNVGANDDLIKTMIGKQFFQTLKNETKQYIDELRRIDVAMYNLGVVAKKTSTEIEEMKLDFLKMASEIPQTAIELANATDILARSGLNYADALGIIEESSKLAVASGEKVESISPVFSKAFVAYKIGAESAEKATNQFYSAILKTPLTMQGLSESLRNSASAFGSYIALTSKSGEELKIYKEQLLQLNIAQTASMTAMGLSASQSGKKYCACTSLTAGRAC